MSHTPEHKYTLQELKAILQDVEVNPNFQHPDCLPWSDAVNITKQLVELMEAEGK
jgi:hypothetical protein